MRPVRAGLGAKKFSARGIYLGTCILGHTDQKSNKYNLTEGLISQAQKLGARVIDLLTGEILEDQSFLEGGPGYGGCPSRSSLSKAHIRPFVEGQPKIEYREGSSYLRSTKDRKFEAHGGGKRKPIKGFSQQSRRRLLETIACIKREAELPCFQTITYPKNFPSVERSKRDLKIFQQRLKRKFPQAGIIWKLEPQDRGAPHFHSIIWGVETRELLLWTVDNWYDIAGDGDENHWKFHMGLLKDSKPCVTKVRSFRGVWSYAAKYLGKTFEVAEWGNKWTGRYWGVINRENIPFGEVRTIETSMDAVVQCMRYQRRYMTMRKRKNLNSLKTFCNADQWISNLIDDQRQMNIKNVTDGARKGDARYT